MIYVRRDTLVRALLAHSEDDLVERVPSVTDEELKRVGKRAHLYAFSQQALRSGGSMGTSRALSQATIHVLDGASRELHREEGQRDIRAEEEALRRLGLRPERA